MQDYREKLKLKITKYVSDLEAETKEEKMEKIDLGLRLVKFLQYENHPDFEKWFNNFCKEKGKEQNGR